MENQKRVKIVENNKQYKLHTSVDSNNSNREQKQQPEQLKIEHIYEEFKLYELMQQTNTKVINNETKFLEHISYHVSQNKIKQQNLKKYKQLHMNMHNSVQDDLELEQKQQQYIQKIKEIKQEQKNFQEQNFVEEHINDTLNYKIKEIEDSKLITQQDIFNVRTLWSVVERKQEHIKEDIIELHFKSQFMVKEVQQGKTLLKNEDDHQKLKLLKQKDQREKKKKVLQKGISDLMKVRVKIQDKQENLIDLNEEINDIDIKREKMDEARQDSLKFVLELDIFDQISKVFLRGNPCDIDLKALLEINNNDNIIKDQNNLEENNSNKGEEKNIEKDMQQSDTFKFKKISQYDDSNIDIINSQQSPISKHRKKSLQNFEDELLSSSLGPSTKNRRKSQLNVEELSWNNIKENYQQLSNHKNLRKQSQMFLNPDMIKEFEVNITSPRSANKSFQNNSRQKQQEVKNFIPQSLQHQFTFSFDQPIESLYAISYFFQKKSQSLIVSQSRERIAEKINKFLNEHDNNLEELEIKIVSNLRKLQMEDVTLNNRLSDMNQNVVNLKNELKKLQKQLFDIKQKNDQQIIQNQYEDQHAEQGEYLIETLFDLKEKNEIIQKNSKIKDKIFEKSEKFISKNFYFFNQLIFRLTSIILAILEKGERTERSKLKKLSKKLYEFTKKLRNILNGNQYCYDQFQHKQNIQQEVQDNSQNLNYVNRQEELLEVIKQQKNELFENNSSEDKFMVHLRQDFVLFNFVKLEDLGQFLKQKIETYKQNDDYYFYFKNLDNFLIEQSLEIKELAIQGYQKSLDILMGSAHDLLVEVKENTKIIKQNDNQFDKNQIIGGISLPRIQLQKRREKQDNKQKNKNNQEENEIKSTKKIYRERIARQKCREYDIYYGTERKKRVKTKAETIVDVIYEAIYDALRNIKSESYDIDIENEHFNMTRQKSNEIELQNQGQIRNQNLQLQNSKIEFFKIGNIQRVQEQQILQNKMFGEYIKLDNTMPKKKSRKIQQMNENLLKKLHQAQLLYSGHKPDCLTQRPNTFVRPNKKQELSQDEIERLQIIKEKEIKKNDEKQQLKQQLIDSHQQNKKQFLQKKFFKQQTIFERKDEEEEQESKPKYPQTDLMFKIDQKTGNTIFSNNSENDLKDLQKLSSDNTQKIQLDLHSSNIPEEIAPKQLQSPSNDDDLQDDKINKNRKKNSNNTNKKQNKLLDQSKSSSSSQKNNPINQQINIQDAQKLDNNNQNADILFMKKYQLLSNHQKLRIVQIPQALSLKSLKNFDSEFKLEQINSQKNSVYDGQTFRQSNFSSILHQSLGSTQDYVNIKKKSPYEFLSLQKQVQSLRNSDYNKIQERYIRSEIDQESILFNQMLKSFRSQKYILNQIKMNQN